MHSDSEKASFCAATRRILILLPAAVVFILLRGPIAKTQSVDFSPPSLDKQRSDILLKVTRAPISEFEDDVNHLAVLSETCRVEYGAKACGLLDKALESDKLEERYAYYVRRPLDTRDKSQRAKIDRHNWAGNDAVGSKKQ